MNCGGFASLCFVHCNVLWQHTVDNVFGFTEVWPIIHLVWYMQVMIFFAKLW